MIDDSELFRHRAARVIGGIAAALVVVGLAAAVLEIPREAPGLSVLAGAGLDATGATHPVTAALLDFRGYDTLLELAVLLMTAVALLAIGRGTLPAAGSDSPVLAMLAYVQAPMMVLVAGYLLWAGAGTPGGAFQAGAILAAAGVLLALAGIRTPLRAGHVWRAAGLSAGPLAFVLIGMLCLHRTAAFLDYPAGDAARLLILLEIGAAISVGLTLYGMFTAVMRSGGKAPETEGDDA